MLQKSSYTSVTKSQKAIGRVIFAKAIDKNVKKMYNSNTYRR